MCVWPVSPILPNYNCHSKIDRERVSHQIVSPNMYSLPEEKSKLEKVVLPAVALANETEASGECDPNTLNLHNNTT